MGNVTVSDCYRIRCSGPAYVTLHRCVFQKMLSAGPVYSMERSPPTRRATSPSSQRGRPALTRATTPRSFTMLLQVALASGDDWLEIKWRKYKDGHRF